MYNMAANGELEDSTLTAVSEKEPELEEIRYIITKYFKKYSGAVCSKAG